MSASVELLQTESKSVADGRSSDPARKHRGLWSFLTRTFVLGQLIVAEHFLGAAARADEAGEALASGEGTSAAAAAEAGNGAGSLSAAAASDESGATSAANAIQAKTMPGTLPQGYEQGLPGSGEPGADVSAEGGAGAQAAGGPLQEPASDVVAGLDGGDSGDGGTGVGQITDPVVDVGDTVNDVLDTVGTGVDNLLNGLEHVVEGLAPALFSPLQNLAQGLPIVGEPLANITGQLGTAVSNVLGDVAEIFPALGNAVGSGVIPLLKSTVSIATNPDTLFEGGKYSDFNITLQSLNEPVTGAVATIGSAAGTLLDGAIDTLDLPGGPQLAALTNTLNNDPLKGGLGDLFS